MNDTHKDLKAISNMLKASSEHGLQVECIWTAMFELSSGTEGIEQACANALCDWDI
jgi:hypothetical protein